MTTQENIVSLLDADFKITNQNDVRNKLKEIKGDNVTYIDMITYLLKEKLRNNSNFSNLKLEEWLEPEGICFKIAKDAKIERTQLRKYFDEIKNIKILLRGLDEENKIPQKAKIKLTALIPKFAYAKGRDLIKQDVYEFFSFCLKKVKDGKKKDFNSFEQILEAILAYHTFVRPKK